MDSTAELIEPTTTTEPVNLGAVLGLVMAGGHGNEASLVERVDLRVANMIQRRLAEASPWPNRIAGQLFLASRQTAKLALFQTAINTMNRFLTWATHSAACIAVACMLLAALACPTSSLMAEEPYDTLFGAQCPSNPPPINGCVNPGQRCYYFSNPSACALAPNPTFCTCPPTETR